MTNLCFSKFAAVAFEYDNLGLYKCQQVKKNFGRSALGNGVTNFVG
jgi:hypothetical protein